MSDIRYAVAPITGIDVRDTQGTDDNTWTMSGYAAVFDQRTTLYDGRMVKITEDIAPEAFNTVLRSQSMEQPAGVVHFNLGHDMNRAVAATDVTPGQPGSLQLTADTQGLRFLAKVPRDDPDGIALATKMRSGVVRQASFAFTISELESRTIEREDGPDEIHDRIMEIGHLYDVCACAQGAYSQTVSGLRSYAAAIGQPFEEGGRHRQPDLGGGSVVSPETGGDVDEKRPTAWSAITLARVNETLEIAKKAHQRGLGHIRK
jgi:HK97 family phage prohead protease